jgi:hypothetical protein
MKEIEQKTLSRVLTLLDTLGFPYAIIDGDGVKHGGLEIAVASNKKERRYPHGAPTRYVRQWMDNMEGNLLEIPVGDFDIDTIQSLACSEAGERWGQGSYTTTRTSDNQTLQLMRLVRPLVLFGDKNEINQ